MMQPLLDEIMSEINFDLNKFLENPYTEIGNHYQAIHNYANDREITALKFCDVEKRNKEKKRFNCRDITSEENATSLLHGLIKKKFTDVLFSSQIDEIPFLSNNIYEQLKNSSIEEDMGAFKSITKNDHPCEKKEENKYIENTIHSSEQNHKMKNGEDSKAKIVRVRGMIRDMLNPEFYATVCHVKMNKNEAKDKTIDSNFFNSFCCMYRDSLPQPSNMYNNAHGHTNATNHASFSESVEPHMIEPVLTRQRSRLICGPIPGETSWLRKQYSRNFSIDKDEDTFNLAIVLYVYDDDEVYEDVGDSADDKNNTTDDKRTTKQKNEDEDNDRFRLNDIVEMVGLLTIPEGPETDADSSSNNNGDFDDFEAIKNFPKFHAFALRKINNQNAFLNEKNKAALNDISFPNKTCLKEGPEIIRSKFQRYFADNILQGDILAAEYILCCLLSRIEKRVPLTASSSKPLFKKTKEEDDEDNNFDLGFEYPDCKSTAVGMGAEFCLVGYFPLVLVQQDIHSSSSTMTTQHTIEEQDDSKKLGEVDRSHKLWKEKLIENINGLVENCILIDVVQLLKTYDEKTDTVANIFSSENDIQRYRIGLTPKKCYSTNLLLPSLLQLPTNTLIILDESEIGSFAEFNQLTKGQIYKHPVVKALNKISVSQQVSYDFGYYSLDFNADCRLLILTTNEKSYICPSAVHVRHEAKNSSKYQDNCVGGNSSLNKAAIEEMRTYLKFTRSLMIELGEDIIVRAEKDYLESRSTNDSETEMETNIDDLHRWLTLARLVTATYGEDLVKLRPHWTRTKALETVRKKREAQYRKEKSFQNGVNIVQNLTSSQESETLSNTVEFSSNLPDIVDNRRNSSTTN